MSLTFNEELRFHELQFADILEEFVFSLFEYEAMHKGIDYLGEECKALEDKIKQNDRFKNNRDIYDIYTVLEDSAENDDELSSMRRTLQSMNSKRFSREKRANKVSVLGSLDVADSSPIMRSKIPSKNKLFCSDKKESLNRIPLTEISPTISCNLKTLGQSFRAPRSLFVEIEIPKILKRTRIDQNLHKEDSLNASKENAHCTNAQSSNILSTKRRSVSIAVSRGSSKVLSSAKTKSTRNLHSIVRLISSFSSKKVSNARISKSSITLKKAPMQTSKKSKGTVKELISIFESLRGKIN